MKITLFKPTVGLIREFYAEIPIEMEVEGTFESLYEFCVKVGALPRIVNIQGMDAGLSDNVITVSPKVKAKFVTMTFRFVSPEEAAAVAEAEAAKTSKKKK